MARYVKYVGTGIRIISERDWKNAGMEGQKPVAWNRGNGWTVDIEPLSEEAQNAILAEPAMIEVSESTAQYEADSARRMPADQRDRSREQRERTEEPTATTPVNAQTNDNGVTTTDTGEKSEPSAAENGGSKGKTK